MITAPEPLGGLTWIATPSSSGCRAVSRSTSACAYVLGATGALCACGAQAKLQAMTLRTARFIRFFPCVETSAHCYTAALLRDAERNMNAHSCWARAAAP